MMAAQTNTQKSWSSSITLQVPFHDVDAMGVVWHGHYAKYFEVARCALLDSVGYGYTQMRASGYAWPIIDFKVRFPRPLTFEQRVRVTATIKEFEHRLCIGYLITDAGTGRRLTRGSTVQVAVNLVSGEACFASPRVLLEKLGAAPA